MYMYVVIFFFIIMYTFLEINTAVNELINNQSRNQESFYFQQQKACSQNMTGIKFRQEHIQMSIKLRYNRV